jgi:hypothetical protein
MPTKTTHNKVECLNPNTGGRMNIDKEVYELFARAIYDTLRRKQPLTYTEMVKGVEAYLKQQKTRFNGSVSWYAVTVKNDMHARERIEVFTEKGRKLHRLIK